jgi:predicted PurR-regulated permease PerM
MEQPNPQSQFPSPDWDEGFKRIMIVASMILVAFIMWQFRSIFPLISIAVLVAYLLYPMTTYYQKQLFRGRLRALAVLMSFITIFLLFWTATLFVIPSLVTQTQGFLVLIPRWVSNTQAWLQDFYSWRIDFAGTPLERFITTPLIPSELLGFEGGTSDFERALMLLQQQVNDINIQSLLQQTFNSAVDLTGFGFSFVGGAFNAVLNSILMLTMTFYLMLDGGNMVNNTARLFPLGYQADFRRLLRELGNVWHAYLRGQIILAFIMGIAMYLVATILGLPNAVLLGLFAGVMEFVPNIGPTIAMVPAAAFALFSTSETIPGLGGLGFVLVVVVIWTLLQQVESVILIPRIVGDSLNLHPFVVLVAVFGGLSVGGIFGVFVAAPVVASSRLVAQYVYGKLLNRNPFPHEPASVEQMRLGRRPLLLRFGDYCAHWVRVNISSRTVTKRSV